MQIFSWSCTHPTCYFSFSLHLTSPFSTSPAPDSLVPFSLTGWCLV